MQPKSLRFHAVTVLAVVVGHLVATDLRAQEVAPAPRLVTVGLYLSPPFVMERDAAFTGMAVELWERVAAEINVEYEHRVFPTFAELVRATSSGEVDVAVTNLTITKNRAKQIDFTHPWFDAGLKIMINEDRRAGFYDVVAGMYDAGHLRAYAWLAFVSLAATALLTLFYRKFDKEFPQRWPEGAAESFYSVMSIVTSGKTGRANLFGWVGRMWSALWLLCGVAVVAYVTSSVTSVMTTLSLTSQINNVADLPGKTVGVFTGSVAEQYARDSGLASRSFRNIDEAVAALLNERISAVIGDAPVLEYHAHTHPEAPLAVVGPIFEPDKYGFGLTHDSDLTKSLTVALLGAHENGVIEALRAEYFGDAP